MPGSLLQAAWRLVRDGACTLPQAVAIVTRGPAPACGLPDRGSLLPGLRGDVIRVREVNGLPVVRESWAQGRRVA